MKLVNSKLKDIGLKSTETYDDKNPKHSIHNAVYVTGVAVYHSC